MEIDRRMEDVCVEEVMMMNFCSVLDGFFIPFRQLPTRILDFTALHETYVLYHKGTAVIAPEALESHVGALEDTFQPSSPRGLLRSRQRPPWLSRC
jgi:hypothetical protein